MSKMLIYVSVGHVFDILPRPLPERPILAPQVLSLKWTSLDLLCGSWLAVYIGYCSHLAFVLRP
jgi:hypothetical protein